MKCDDNKESGHVLHFQRLSSDTWMVVDARDNVEKFKRIMTCIYSPTIDTVEPSVIEALWRKLRSEEKSLLDEVMIPVLYSADLKAIETQQQKLQLLLNDNEAVNTRKKGNICNHFKL